MTNLQYLANKLDLTEEQLLNILSTVDAHAADCEMNLQSFVEYAWEWQVPSHLNTPS
jgi:hypothetical protein